jgi:hypothetical protein
MAQRLFGLATSQAEFVIALGARCTTESFADVRRDRLCRVAHLRDVQQTTVADSIDQAVESFGREFGGVEDVEIAWGHAAILWRRAAGLGTIELRA